MQSASKGIIPGLRAPVQTRDKMDKKKKGIESSERCNAQAGRQAGEQLYKDRTLFRDTITWNALPVRRRRHEERDERGCRAEHRVTQSALWMKGLPGVPAVNSKVSRSFFFFFFFQ